jgi:plasmid stabilization system protein ParE
MVKIKWLLEAKEDLRTIYEFIAQDSENYALHQVSRIFSKTKILVKHKYAGRIVPELGRTDSGSLLKVTTE